MTSAPNYTEEGQYMVYYEITYTYKGKEMTENGVAKVWLRDESTKDDGSCACAAAIPTAAARTRIVQGAVRFYRQNRSKNDKIALQERMFHI